MSESDVNRAKKDVEQSVSNFERALDLLLQEVERGIGHVDIPSKLREIVNVDETLERAKESATELMSSLRETAEQEIRKMDSKPLMTWGAVLVSGFVLGYVLAKKTANS